MSDNDLNVYQKIFGMIQSNYIIRKYNCFDISYIKSKEIEENSVLFEAVKFFRKLVEHLSEESPLFDPAEKSHSREYDNFYENVGNNAFQGEINKNA